MKRYLWLGLLIMSFVFVAEAQRREIGPTRDSNVGGSGERDSHGRSGQSRPVENPTPPPPPPTPVTHHDPPPIHPSPPILIERPPTCYVQLPQETVNIIEQPQ